MGGLRRGSWVCRGETLGRGGGVWQAQQGSAAGLVEVAAPAGARDLRGSLAALHFGQRGAIRGFRVGRMLVSSIRLCRAGWVPGGSVARSQGLATSPWLLLPQVPSWAMDMNVLMSAQLLMEQVAAEGSGPLLYLLYQHLLFNFHLWSPSDFAVRLGRCGALDEGTAPRRVGGRGSEKL